MTLIALTVNQGYPVMMADILLSSIEGSGMSLPTFVDGSEHLFIDQEDKPIILNQKLYVINDRLCVSLGGRADRMFTVLNKLQTFFSDVNFNDAELDASITEWDNEYGKELIAIILRCIRKDDDQHQFFVRTIGNIKPIESKTFGAVFAAGSGAEVFKQFLTGKHEVHSDIENSDIFLANNLSVIGYFLSKEILDGKTLKDLWGAGFEMIIYEDNKFVKLREYTLVVLMARFGKNHPFECFPVRTMFFSYEDDVLLIRAILNNKEKTFAIPAINDDREVVNVKLPDPEHEKLVVAYIFSDEDSDGTVYHRVGVSPRNPNKEGESPVVFYRDERGKLIMLTSKKYDKYFYDSVLDQINRGL